MLKQRVITALILAPLVISSVLLLPTAYVALLLAVVVLVGSREWARLSGFTALPQQLLYTLLMLLLLGCSYLWLPAAWIPAIIGIAVLWWCFVLLRIIRYRSEHTPSENALLKGLEGIVVLLPPWLALVTLHQIPDFGPGLMLFVLMLIWSADVGAYFAGHRWGNHKLAPQVSPGKTREGVYGAMVSALLCGVVLLWWLDTSLLKSMLILLLCLVTMLSSVVGDLFESLLKRQRGMKDSGTLLPGHGGMLDRIDSLTAAAPVFLFGLTLLGVA
ncbi:MAG: phosphatidate cytidylyltransferase [Chromatiales bacterium]|nr:phosphatidate cytidylyltransferase [Chromatiales bacterium]